MPRRSVVATAETRRRVVRKASEAFRARGSAVAIGDVMKELGLTNGGFYRHFKSKDDLFAESVALSLTEMSNTLAAVAERADPGDAVGAIVRWYLRPEHLRHPERGCALATLSPDVARQTPEVQAPIHAAIALLQDKLQGIMEGRTKEVRRTKVLMLFSGMAGSVALLRSFAEPEEWPTLLEQYRTFYIESFTPAPARHPRL